MPGRTEGTWTFLTNHAHVLVCIAEKPDIRTRPGRGKPPSSALTSNVVC